MTIITMTIMTIMTVRGFGHDIVFGQGIQLMAQEVAGASAPSPFAVRDITVVGWLFVFLTFCCWLLVVFDLFVVVSGGKGEALQLTVHISEQRELLQCTLRREDDAMPGACGRVLKRRSRGRGSGS